MANTGLKKHGKNGAIYLGGDNTTGTKVAAKTAWTLQRNRDYVDATVFGDVNKTYLAGLPNVQGTFDGFLDCSGDLLLDAATSDSTDLYLYADDDNDILVANGPALVDATVNVSNTDGARISGEFRANGAWTIAL